MSCSTDIPNNIEKHFRNSENLLSPDDSNNTSNKFCAYGSYAMTK